MSVLKQAAQLSGLPWLEMSLQMDPSAIEKLSLLIDFSVGEAGLFSQVAVLFWGWLVAQPFTINAVTF